jgi:hypothetical protein
MKAYRRSENIDPKIFLLSAKIEVIIAFLPLCPRINPHYLISRRLGGLNALGLETFFPVRIRNPDRSACNLVTAQTQNLVLQLGCRQAGSED